MAQHYSDPARADDPYALPNLETFEAFPLDCEVCDASLCVGYGEVRAYCEECQKWQELPAETGELRWYYWYCFPGCLPDGDPVGPFETEEEALADAREGVEHE